MTLAIRWGTYMLIIILPPPSQLSLYAANFTNSRRLQRESNSDYGSQISFLESKLPHRYDFIEFQFDYKGVPRHALLT